ncbi:hypothetical protein GCM10014715_88560 [Streptomyces spiralis]|uniref:Uncharacterized protein n=1 Tax=Streptomyces spiralis TaxID=66376 RepID=A0A919E6Z2_9ACTN|nr:hypothetical protein GCM10014715_88560 [Streptomyces spiralis]
MPFLLRSGRNATEQLDRPRKSAGRPFGHMAEVPRRIDPITDRATTALILGCRPDQVGYCPSCQGLTCRYGPTTQAICPSCRAAEQNTGTAPSRRGRASDLSQRFVVGLV